MMDQDYSGYSKYCQITEPVCLGCSCLVSGSYSCPRCGWPLCGPNCPMKQFHEPECEVSQCRKSMVVVNKFQQINEMYECITPIRCLQLKSKDRDKWKKLVEMESHLADRKKTGALDLDKSNVIDFIRGYLKYNDFLDDDAYRICGILEVNGFEIPHPNVIGLFGMGCLLEHSCVPNTTRTFDLNRNVIIRAAVDIRKGDHLTTSYTDPMWGTASRQMHLSSSKYFKCTCRRCSDPTELGTHFSSLKCQKCLALVDPPLSQAENWQCRSCGETLTLADVQKTLRTWGERLIKLKGSLTHSQDFLDESVSELGDNHHYRVEVKLAMSQFIGSQELTEVSDQLWHRKVQLCEECLQFVDTFTPGRTRLRGLLQFEKGMSMWELFRRRTAARINAESSSYSELQVMKNCLEEAHSILVLEQRHEHETALQAQHLVSLIAHRIAKLKQSKKKKK